MKNKTISENYKKRLQQLAGLLKEGNGPFNDAGEPMMTHNQYKDYSEPAEDEMNDFKHSQDPLELVIEELKKQYNVHFYKPEDTYVLYISNTPLHYLALAQQGQNLVIGEYDELNGYVEKFRDSINPDDLEWGKLFDFFQDFLNKNPIKQEPNNNGKL